MSNLRERCREMLTNQRRNAMLRQGDAMTPPITRQAEDQRLALKYYDAGYLGNGGGGDIEWWQNYIRSLLEDAHQFYAEQFVHPPQVGDGREAATIPLIAPHPCSCCGGEMELNGLQYTCDQQSSETFHVDDVQCAPVRAAAEPGEMRGPSETWAHIEHLLVHECGLMTDCGLEHQRSNCINAIKNGLPDTSLMAAAIEFLISGEGLHKIRVNGKMMDRNAVAGALSASANEGER